MNDERRNFSRQILRRLVVLSVLAFAIAVAVIFSVGAVYFDNQLTAAGLIINGTILGLFLLGLLRIVTILLRYQAEEEALATFTRALEGGSHYPDEEISPDRIIAQRYEAIRYLSDQSAAIDHNALASILVASESTRLSFPKFINNILILCGVFGTIVSLSIALVGASNLLGSVEQMSSMGMVIHGMSTALSTTITAIVCYLFFGYFYLKLTDAQTHLFSTVEGVTSLYLLPRYAHTPETLLSRVAGLIHNLQGVASSMQQAQADYADAGKALHEVLAEVHAQVSPMSRNIDAIKAVLHEGFRLPPREEPQ